MTQQDLSVSPAESLSALVDGEASELELRRILKNLDRDQALASAWSRHHLVSAALKQELPARLASTSFSASVMAALDDEPTYGTQANQFAASAAAPRAPAGLAAPAAASVTTLWQNIGRMAVAASVAGALVIGGLQVLQDPSQAPSLTPAMVDAAPRAPQTELPSGINVPALSARTVAVQSDFASRQEESRRVIYVPHQQAAPIYNEEMNISLDDLIQERTGSTGAPFTRIILLDDE